uniref:Uncharacterized protein n=1 Tax=Romanomermis culicivorax TaxID=13658 RepID=A0A915I7A8_ROMCU
MIIGTGQMLGIVIGIKATVDIIETVMSGFGSPLASQVSVTLEFSVATTSLEVFSDNMVGGAGKNDSRDTEERLSLCSSSAKECDRIIAAQGEIECWDACGLKARFFNRNKLIIIFDFDRILDKSWMAASISDFNLRTRSLSTDNSS